MVKWVVRLIALKLCWHNPSSKSSRLLIGGNLYIRIPSRLSLSFPVRSSLRSGHQWSPFLLWWHVSAIHFHLHGSELYTTVGYFTWSRGRGLIQLWRELDRGDLLNFYSYFCVSVGVMMMLAEFLFLSLFVFLWARDWMTLETSQTCDSPRCHMARCALPNAGMASHQTSRTYHGILSSGRCIYRVPQTNIKRSRNMWWPSFLRQNSWTIPRFSGRRSSTWIMTLNIMPAWFGTRKSDYEMGSSLSSQLSLHRWFLVVFIGLGCPPLQKYPHPNSCSLATRGEGFPLGGLCTLQNKKKIQSFR